MTPAAQDNHSPENIIWTCQQTSSPSHITQIWKLHRSVEKGKIHLLPNEAAAGRSCCYCWNWFGGMRTETAQAGVSCRAVQRESSLLYEYLWNCKDHLRSQSPSLCKQIEGLLGIPAWFPIKSRYSLSDTGLFRRQRIAGSSRSLGTKQQQAPQLHVLVRLLLPSFEAECPPSSAAVSFLCLDGFTDPPPASAPPPDFPLCSILPNGINNPVRGKYVEWNRDPLLSFFAIKIHVLYFMIFPFLSDEWVVSTLYLSNKSTNPVILKVIILPTFCSGTADCLELHTAQRTQKCAPFIQIPEKAWANAECNKLGAAGNPPVIPAPQSLIQSPHHTQTAQAICYMGPHRICP